MTKVRITKLFEFEMAHVLDNYDGLCSNIHGHSYKLSVTARGEIEENSSSPKVGMVLDFSVLKTIVRKEIIDKLDHALLLPNGSPHAASLQGLSERIYTVDYQPTCEKMVVDFANRISQALPPNIELVSVRLHETATSFAEWFAEDNK